MDAVLAARQALLESLQTLQQQRDAQMKRYQAAHNDHQVLLELQKQQKDEYEHEQERAQQKRLDDLFAARRHLRT
jgi:flagellar biosynthesis chaperone FliJ